MIYNSRIITKMVVAAIIFFPEDSRLIKSVIFERTTLDSLDPAIFLFLVMTLSQVILYYK
jgi:hypothetical protein